MHSHLHTEKNKACEEIMTMLDECHARGFMYKVTGGCNDIKNQVNKCLGQQRAERTKKNREVAKEKRQKIQAAWAEVDANS